MDNVPLLADEAVIVWLQDIEELDYVREGMSIAMRPRRRIHAPRGAHLVGYAMLRHRARSRKGVCHQRVFTLRDHDRPLDPSGPYANSCPSEAVDPFTVFPGVRGKKTPRCEGGSR